MSPFLIAAISLLSGLVAFVAMVGIAYAAEGMERAVQWAQRLGKAECRWCHCPVPKTEDYCDRHRHLGPIRGGIIRRRRPVPRQV